MTKLEIAFQSVKVAIGIFLAFLAFGYTHQPVKLGQVYGVPAYEDFSYSTSATTTLARFPGNLHTIVIGTPVANSVITVYDVATSTSAIVASSTAVVEITIPATATAPFSLSFDNRFYNGLTVVQSGATSTLTAEYQQN